MLNLGIVIQSKLLMLNDEHQVIKIAHIEHKQKQLLSLNDRY